MNKLTDNERMDALLKLIGRDDDLMESVAQAIGDDPKDFGDFLDFVEIPPLSRGEQKTRHTA